jgi:hypothetical protein
VHWHIKILETIKSFTKHNANMIFLDSLQDGVHNILLGMANLKILGGMQLIASGCAHRDLLHAPTMWETMNTVANLNLKSMVQTTDNLQDGVHDMKSPLTRTSTTTPRGGSPQELQDRQELHTPTTM